MWFVTAFWITLGTEYGGVNVKMKITTIRITKAQHDWITNNKQNQLSSIVRDRIDEMMHMETPVNFHNAWREGAQKCYPFQSGGYCSICWPAGVPDRSYWMEYVKAFPVGSRSRLTFEEWSMQKHDQRQQTLDEWNRDTHSYEVSDQESRDAISDQRGIIRRIWRFFF